MSDYFESFIQLIEQQPELFTEEDREYLRQQEWSKDKDDIENEIMEWAKPKLPIYTALTDLSIRDRLPGDGKAPPKKESEYQPLLQNTIHRCFPKPENQSKSSAKPKAK